MIELVSGGSSCLDRFTRICLLCIVNYVLGITFTSFLSKVDRKWITIRKVVILISEMQH